MKSFFSPRLGRPSERNSEQHFQEAPESASAYAGDRRNSAARRRRSRSRSLGAQAVDSLSKTPSKSCLLYPHFVLRSTLLVVMTGLGWALVNSVEVRPQSSAPRTLPTVISASRQATTDEMTSTLPTPLPEPSTDLGRGQEIETAKPEKETDEPASDTVLALERLQPLTAFQPAAKASDVVELSGNQIRLNGRTVLGLWQQRNGRLGISSAAMANMIGVELLSTTDPNRQPIRWYPATQDEVIALNAWWDSTERYLDVTDLAVRAGWSGEATGRVLDLEIPASEVRAIRQGKQTWGDRIVVDLSGPASWQLEADDVYTLTIAGRITPERVRAFRAARGNLITRLDVAPLNGHTVLKIRAQEGASPLVWTTGGPPRLVIDIRQDAMVERDVAWAPGLRWRQQYVALGNQRFPVYMFVLRPDPANLSLKPIRANSASSVGIEPILTTAQRLRVAGAVNAGFFNRNNQLPLGAVRLDGQWLSGPILGRGAMAWNEQGDLVMDRLVLSEVITTQSGQSFPVLATNSGYVQAGIGRYTSGWGNSYTPIVDNEIVVTVRNDEITNRQTLGKGGSGRVEIPADGYLLTLRSAQNLQGNFEPGARLSLASQSQPSVFDQYPNIVGGGPLLIRDRAVVLNPQQEGFTTNFIQGSAPRTAVGKTADGTWIIATIHERVGGRGPTLSETARIMQQLGAVDALNLDGGSSSSLYLGGQLINRQPRTAARVNNGIGLFILGRD